MFNKESLNHFDIFEFTKKNNYNMQETIPIHAQWDITSGCNFKCVFCLSSSGYKDKFELSTDEGMALIDKLYDAGIVFLRVLGGEPFFRKDILKIFKYASKKGMIISFSTNASLITPKTAEILYHLRNSISYIQMSLYGENEETYKQVTGSEKNFQLALKGLKLLLEKQLEVTILTVATENNSHRISKYFEIAKKYGVREFRITPKIGLGRAAKEVDNKIFRTTKIWSILIKELSNIKNSLKEADPLIRIDARPLFGSYLYKKTGIPYYYQNCTAATTMIYIDSTGKVSPCPFQKHMPNYLKEKYSHIGTEDILHNSFQDVWTSKTFEKCREYYDPDKNLFRINTKCKFYKNSLCIPCIITPCNCKELIKSVQNELTS